ncbi:MAG: hypothetical protein WED07_12570 [Candidatus Freyarchaeum deiterrae]
MSEETVVNRLIDLVELNVGKWKPIALAIVDLNYNVWGKKGNVSKEFFKYYKRFPLSEMNVGESINNSGSFLMKVTEKTGALVILGDPRISRLAEVNLRGRLPALSEFYTLEKFIK